VPHEAAESPGGLDGALEPRHPPRHGTALALWELDLDPAGAVRECRDNEVLGQAPETGQDERSTGRSSVLFTRDPGDLPRIGTQRGPERQTERPVVALAQFHRPGGAGSVTYPTARAALFDIDPLVPELDGTDRAARDALPAAGLDRTLRRAECDNHPHRNRRNALRCPLNQARLAHLSPSALRLIFVSLVIVWIAIPIPTQTRNAARASTPRPC
jgi:hypothetical protein